MDHPDADVQPAAHAARVGGTGTIGSLGKIERVEDLLRPDLRVGLAHVEQSALDDELLAPGRAAVGTARLGDVADLAANLVGPVRHVEARDGRLAGRRRQERGEDAQGRRLARAVGPQETEDVACGDAERHTSHGFDGARLGLEGAAQVTRLDDLLRSHPCSLHRRCPRRSTCPAPPCQTPFLQRNRVRRIGYRSQPPRAVPVPRCRRTLAGLLRYNVSAQRRQ